MENKVLNIFSLSNFFEMRVYSKEIVKIGVGEVRPKVEFFRLKFQLLKINSNLLNYKFAIF